jgi:hypothetical protein
MSDTEKYLEEMNQYFANITGCSHKHVHSKTKCVYLGTVTERLAKYKEIKAKHSQIH